jgi:hypothetical protein
MMHGRWVGATIGWLAAAVVASVVAGGCERQQPAPPVEEPTATAETRELGPFTLDSLSYTLVLSVLQHAGAETVQRFTIVDDSGRVHFEETLDAPVAAPHGFEATATLRALYIEGVTGRGVLLIRERQPSAPLTGVTYQIFGQGSDQLQPLTAPLSWYGEQPLQDTTARALRLDLGDVLMLQLWRFHFGVTLPLRFDLACEPGADTCVQPAATPAPDAPEFGLLEVDAELREPQARSYITLLAQPGAANGARVPVHADSRIQVLQAAARVSLRAGGTLDVIVRDEHLRVRIDGREGWIRGPEDFEAIGLQAAG